MLQQKLKLDIDNLNCRLKNNKKLLQKMESNKLKQIEDEINDKLGKIIGQKFIDYRKKWDAVNRMEIITDFPMFLQLDMN